MTHPQPITVQTLVGPATLTPIAVRREPTESEHKLKLALKLGGMHHTYSMAQVVGIWPA